jgi:protocatechuate 3,4-dioxygenase beta subunit
MHPIVRLVPFSSVYLGAQPVPPPSTHTVSIGESIASEGKGEYMYVEGRVLTTSGEPIPGAVIDTWEADSTGEQSLEVQHFAFPPA